MQIIYLKSEFSGMKSLMILSEGSGMLIYSESYSNNVEVSSNLSDIQLSSSLFALYKFSCTLRALKWLKKVFKLRHEAVS